MPRLFDLQSISPLDKDTIAIGDFCAYRREVFFIMEVCTIHRLSSGELTHLSGKIIQTRRADYRLGQKIEGANAANFFKVEPIDIDIPPNFIEAIRNDVIDENFKYFHPDRRIFVPCKFSLGRMVKETFKLSAIVIKPVVIPKVEEIPMELSKSRDSYYLLY